MPLSPATNITAVEICLVYPTNHAEVIASSTPLVPVLPATGRSSEAARRPVPSSTTEVSESVTFAATFWSIVCSLGFFAS